MSKAIVLKAGKEKPLRNRHHWIFSGAIASSPQFTNGDLLPVQSITGELLGYGYFNRHGSIAGRMISFGTTLPIDGVRTSLKEAIEMRSALFNPKETNAFRLVNGEGDALPGLIVDRYADYLVVQFTTLGMDRLRDTIIPLLNELLSPKAIYEKSVGAFRREEGITDVERVVSGERPKELMILESGYKFLVDPMKGQKTGFFLDHREMRKQIQQLSKGRRVLNCFSYTGGFSVYALAGGAKRVDSVDLSKEAVEGARTNVKVNGFDPDKQGFISQDVFQFLREFPLDYDLVILDPPAFAKRKNDVVAACRGYKDINRLALQKMQPGLLLTSSCSYHVDSALFQTVLFQAASEAGRSVKIIGRHVLAPDHPINLYHPEGDYLKSLLLYVE